MGIYSIGFLFIFLGILYYLLQTSSSKKKAKEVLCIYTRYPETGRCKTRLIPKLGAEGATVLQRKMTSHICRVARNWELGSSDRAVEVHYDISEQIVKEFRERFPYLTQQQAEKQILAEWLGFDITYHRQATGGMTQRLTKVFEGRSSGQNVCVIASDTPEITPKVLELAFEKLKKNQVVVGPAEDGGYYLLGQSRFTPEVFTGIDEPIPWSTDKVFSMTVDVCKKLGVSVGTDLPVISDIDNPEDLKHWDLAQHHMDQFPFHQPKISVIVPVMNEALSIVSTLTRLVEGFNLEIIVSDGGSTDSTAALVQEFQEKLASSDCPNSVVKLIQSPKGRAVQQNTAADQATGEILLFVHGDTTVPRHFDCLVRQVMAQKQFSAGAFSFRIEDNDRVLFRPGRKLIECFTNMRAKYLQLPYGDQCLFMRKATFEKLGGFPKHNILEDFEMVRNLQKLGKVEIISTCAPTSGRRWKRLGLIKVTMINQLIISGYLFGMDTNNLARLYYQGWGKDQDRKQE